MVRIIKTMFYYQWVSYWRRVSQPENVNKYNSAIVFLILLYVLFSVITTIGEIKTELIKGDSPKLELLLMVTSISYLLLPITELGFSIRAEKVKYWPLSAPHLIGLRLVSLFVAPYSWPLLILSLLTFSVFTVTSTPILAIFAVLLLYILAIFMGIFIAQLIKLAIWRNIFFLLFLFIAISFGSNITNITQYINIQFFIINNPFSLIVHITNNRHPLQILLVLITANLMALLMTFLSANLTANQINHKPIFRTFFNKITIPGLLGEIIKKDIIYFMRSRNIYLSLSISCLGSLYLVHNLQPSLIVVIAFLLIAVALGSDPAFNYFSLDGRAGLVRYASFPISNSSIIISKNLAFLVIILLTTSPLALLTCGRLGLKSGALLLLIEIVIVMAYLTPGNYFSVKGHLFFVDNVLSILFAHIPAIFLINIIVNAGGGKYWGYWGLIILFYVGLYTISVIYSAKYLKQNYEKLLSVLNKV